MNICMKTLDRSTPAAAPRPRLRPTARPSGCHGGWLVAAAVIASWSTAASGHDLTPYMGRPATERRHFQGNPFDRAGNPQCVSPLAKPAESPHEEGYFVGGGARMRGRGGEERHDHEGTWGVDYTGIIVHKRTNLGWWHGSRYQGGVGAYGTDGPRLVHRP
jgi:hypothetical protein